MLNCRIDVRRSPIAVGTSSHRRSVPTGLTLIEMLVALAITLIMMAAVVNLFASIGSSVRSRRATMEMGSQLRLVRQQLFTDLAGATCSTLTWQRPENNLGYIEIVGGEYSDHNPTGITIASTVSQVPSSNLPLPTGDITDGKALGDYDDMLALTVRGGNGAFRGQGRVINPATTTWIDGVIESSLAEVVWYAVENPDTGSLGEPGMRTVYRRVLLIAPWVDLSGIAPSGATPVEQLRNYYADYDISVRIEGGEFVPNTLGDLTKRENRFGHDPTTFPHLINQSYIRFATAGGNGPLHPLGPEFLASTAEREGEDLMLSDVLAFDVRLFEPGAPLVAISGTVLEPSDEGWFEPKAVGEIVGFGAYVDLGWAPNYPDPADPTFPPSVPKVYFQTQHRAGWHPSDTAGFVGFPTVYDTWSFHYENDGLDQDSASDNGAGIDQGTNGLDDLVPYDLDDDPTTPPTLPPSAINGVDDIGERETSPPYDVALRGIQVKLRVYERDSRHIREATVTRNFVPQ